MIVRAILEDATKLTEIALASKAYWGYTSEQIESWREDLTVTSEMFEKWHIYKFVSDNKIEGFHILNLEKPDELCELKFLFISPDFIGKKVGSSLLKHAFQLAKEMIKL